MRYQKTDLGEVTEREQHPLRDAYHTTAKRIIRYSPQLSVKQQPMLCWHLFSIDGLPRCVNMQSAAKKRFRFGRGWQSAAPPDKPNVGTAGEGSGISSHEQPAGTAASAAVAPPPSSEPGPGGVSAAAHGLMLCTFPPLSKFPRHEFAPHDTPEPVAARFAELSRATITRAARELYAERRAEHARKQDEEAARMQGAPRRAKVSLGVRKNGTVKLSVAVLSDDLTEEDEDEAEVVALATCVLEEVDKLRLAFDRQRAHSLHTTSRALEEVLMMAAYLGLPYGAELGTEHLWIADAALCPELPLGWTSHGGGDDECWYQNTVTRECMWEHPQVAFLRGVAEAATLANDAIFPEPPAQPAAVLEKQRTTSFVTRNLRRRSSVVSLRNMLVNAPPSTVQHYLP